jgi:Xaa-Pro aminopeptidase
MEMTYFPAIAALGTASGSFATFFTTWVVRRRQDRLRRVRETISQRQELYKSFIEESSRLYADALVNDKSEIPKLVNVYALIGRMKIVSNDEVIAAAEKAGRLIIATYLSPNRTLVDLPDLISEMDPLHDFSEACRRELRMARLH